jgi:hypothetical protein
MWSRALLEMSTVVKTLDSFPAFYGTQRFNTKFKLSTSPMPDQPGPHHPNPTSYSETSILNITITLHWKENVMNLNMYEC